MVKQVFIRPGKYRVGGLMRDYNRGYLAKAAAETNRAIAAGLPIGFIARHVPPGDPLGMPTDAARHPSDATLNKGWVKGVNVLPDGSLEHDTDVTDPAMKAAIANGSVRFSSPQFTEEFWDGHGNKYGPLITHMAATPNPRTFNQGHFQFANHVQFSMDDAELIPDDEEGEDETPLDIEEISDPPPVENENLPPSTDANLDREAAVAGLQQMGCMVPAKWGESLSPEDLTVLIGVVNTMLKMKQEADAAKDAEALPNADEGTVEEPVQFSLEQIHASSPAVRKTMLAANAALQAARDQAVQFANEQQTTKRAAAIAKVKSDRKLPRGLRLKLLQKLETVQFSAAGEAPTLTVEEVATLISDTLPIQFAADVEDLTEENDPLRGTTREEEEANAETNARRIASRGRITV